MKTYMVIYRHKGEEYVTHLDADDHYDARWTLHMVRHKAETDHREGMGLLPLYRRITRHGATR